MLLVAFLSLIFNTAFGEDLCSSYEEYCPGYMRSASSAYPSLISGFSTNPSGLPTSPSPAGFELAYNSSGDFSRSGTSFGGVKGMPGYGFGVARTKDNTFYTYSLKQALQGTNINDITGSTNPLTGQPYTLSAQNMERSLTTFSYAQSLFPKAETIKSALGAAGVIDSLSSTLNFAFGASVQSRNFSLAWSFLPLGGNTARNVPETSSTTINAGLSFSGVSAEYSILNYRTKDSSLKSLQVFSDSVNTYTLAYDSKALHATVARRESTNILNQRVHLNMAALLWRISSYFSVSLMKNYIPGAHSFGVEFFY